MQLNPTKQSVFSPHFSEQENALVKQAVELFEQCPTPENYSRPRGFDIAIILMDFNVNAETIIASILSDPLLLKSGLPGNIAEQFGSTVANLVKDLNWLNTINVYSTDMSRQPNQAETLRRMLLAMTQDVRAVLIKLAYRVKRLQNLDQEDPAIQQFIAKETLDIYAPLANRLGIYQLKWLLEDLAFRYQEPQQYRYIAKSLADSRSQRENHINQFIDKLQQELSREEIPASIYGRPKHIYSIWKKMQRKQLDIIDLYDLLAVRIIVESLTQCYTVLGLVHSLWQFIPKEFDDYIANPKENGYQSLHTVILDKEGHRIETQIRTKAMHEYAELGVAAHWAYKEGSKQNSAAEKSIASLRQLLDENSNDESLIENFRNELFSDRIYVLTPAGKLIDLIKGSTPIDFAYSIHTEIGHRCRGAKVNGHIVQLTYQLQSGDQVEILTAKEGGPNRNWIDTNLGYLKSHRAISKVKSWFKQQQFEHNLSLGQTILEKETQRLGIKDIDLKKLCHRFNQDNTDKFLAAIGQGLINTRQLANALYSPEQETDRPAAPNKAIVSSDADVYIEGVNNVHTSLAQCCSPVAGDAIIGFISPRKGITIHRQDCKNISRLNPAQHNRLVSANWGQAQKYFSVPIFIHAFNSQDLLTEVTKILTQNKIHISSATLDTQPDLSAYLKLKIQIQDSYQLSDILNKISQLPNILEAKRYT